MILVPYVSGKVQLAYQGLNAKMAYDYQKVKATILNLLDAKMAYDYQKGKATILDVLNISEETFRQLS